jgi:hypothetical protein
MQQVCTWPLPPLQVSTVGSLYIKHDELFSWKGDIDNALSMEYLRLFYRCEESLVSTHPGTLRQVSRLPCESSLPHAYARHYFLSFPLPLELSRLPAPVNLLRSLLTRTDQRFLYPAQLGHSEQPAALAVRQ